jgi:hypothetical protein
MKQKKSPAVQTDISRVLLTGCLLTGCAGQL